MIEEKAAPTATHEAGAPARGLWRLLRRKLTPRLAAGLALWRIEAYLATPLALTLVATLGRWTGALAMGSLMALFAAAFLFLLDGAPILDDIHAWARQRRLGRVVEALAERPGWQGKLRRALAVPGSIMFMGPFWRAVTYHLFRVPRWPAYVLSVGGSFPHSLLWTGLVLGGVWEGLLRPALEDLL